MSAGFVDSADDEFRDACGFRIGVGIAELLEEKFLHGGFVGNGIEKIVAAFVLVFLVESGRKGDLIGIGITFGGELDDFGQFVFHIIPFASEFGFFLLPGRGKVIRFLGGLDDFEYRIVRKLLIDFLLEFEDRSVENIQRLKLLRGQRLFLTHFSALKHSLCCICHLFFLLLPVFCFGNIAQMDKNKTRRKNFFPDFRKIQRRRTIHGRKYFLRETGKRDFRTGFYGKKNDIVSLFLAFILFLC